MKIVLFGAGGAGSYAVQFLRAKGIPVLAFADNDPKKWEKQFHGRVVLSPQDCQKQFPDATWVACALRSPEGRELREQLRLMKVSTKPLWECLPVCHGLPAKHVQRELNNLVYDGLSYAALQDQYAFREAPDYDLQGLPTPISELYFPDFVKPLDDEYFVDCGAADGDTMEQFLAKWENFSAITAIEPDRKNVGEIRKKYSHFHNVEICHLAVGDYTGKVAFLASGDTASHVSSEGTLWVPCTKLDAMFFRQPPTYIKMDIEGAELEALWGARQVMQEHRPVFAVCAYHSSAHLWKIPLLIHALQPDYRLFFRRYAEGSFEIVWYAVPPERIR
jgi:FkbM family methyltransferase